MRECARQCTTETSIVRGCANLQTAAWQLWIQKHLHSTKQKQMYSQHLLFVLKLDENERDNMVRGTEGIWVSQFTFSAYTGQKSLSFWDRQQKSLPLFFLCLLPFPFRSLFLVLLIWSLGAGDTGAINHNVTGVDMSLLSLMLMTPLSAFPLQRWYLDTVHLTCHFPALRSALCTEPIRTRRTFNFICSATLQGFFSSSVTIVQHSAAHCDVQYCPHSFRGFSFLWWWLLRTFLH